MADDGGDDAQAERQADDYYADFDRLSGGGKVLSNDLSAIEKDLPTKLTEQERNTRRTWRTNREAIKTEYILMRNSRREVVQNQNALLRERIVPKLVTIDLDDYRWSPLKKKRKK